MSVPERGLQHTPTGRLTKIYSDTKRTYDSASSPSVSMDGDPLLKHLHRQLQVQKERLMNWGLDWSDKNMQHGDIDQPLERAGLTGLVESLMISIKETLDQAEEMIRRNNGLSGYRGWEKSPRQSHWTATDKSRLDDLVKELTSSIDTLYDLSRSWKEAMPPGERGARQMGGLKRNYMLNTDYPSPASSSSSGKASDFGGKRPPLELLTVPERPVSKIDPSSLIFSDHGSWASSRPPPYEAIMTHSGERTLAYLKDPSNTLEPWKVDTYGVSVMPVMIEYAAFDPVFTQTGISASLTRLHSLANVLNHCTQNSDCMDGFLRLLGFFEATSSSYGIIYELPTHVFSLMKEFELSLAAVMPVSLLSLLLASTSSPSSQFPDLEVRLRLAYNLTSTLFELHSKGFLHRVVNSNNILLFPRARSPSSIRANYAQGADNNNADLRHSYLSFFDVFSADGGVEGSEGSQDLDIYRHPLDPRHDGTRKQSYLPSFDIYSLGLILLEIGLWMPLRSFWKHKYTVGMFKSRIESIYVKKLAAKCGSCYMRAVQQCLSIGGCELASPDGKVNPKAYSVILQRLQRCCMIDEHDPPPTISPVLESQLSQNSPSVSSAFSPISFFAKPMPGTSDFPLPASRSSPTLGQTQKEKDSQFSVPRKSVSADAKTMNSKSLLPETISSPKLHVDQAESPLKKRKIKVYPARLTPDQLADWHQNVLPRLERILEKTLKDPCETVSMDLVSAGDSKETAKPTIVVTCSSVAKVKAVITRRLKYDRSFYELRVRKGKVHRSKGPSRRRKSPTKSFAGDSEEEHASPANPFHQTRPLCGASIGAFTFSGDGSGTGSHSPAASYGGIVLIDGEPFGMTAHHLLDEPSDADDSDAEGDDIADAYPSSSAQRSMASRLGGTNNWEPEPSASGHQIAEDDDDYAFEMTDDEGYYDSADENQSEHMGEAYYDEDDYSEDESDEDFDDTFGNTAGIEPGDGEGLIITQPAYEDVDPKVFDTASDKDDKHLNEHSLGYVHASSGARRWTQGGINHEIDWALLKLHDERLQPFNLVQGGKRYARRGGCQSRPTLRDPICRGNYSPEEDLYPVEVADMNELGGKEVHCFGRTTGLQRGVINGAMSGVRLSGRRTFSRSWHIWGNLGVGGDSGAWIIDNERGRVCGHVLARSSRFLTTYICPMQLLIQDIARTVNATTISLPLGEDIELVAAESRVGATSITAPLPSRRLTAPFDMLGGPEGIYAPGIHPFKSDQFNETDDDDEAEDSDNYPESKEQTGHNINNDAEYSSQLTDDVMDLFKQRLRQKFTVPDLEGLRIRSSPSPLSPEPEASSSYGSPVPASTSAAASCKDTKFPTTSSSAANPHSSHGPRGTNPPDSAHTTTTTTKAPRRSRAAPLSVAPPAPAAAHPRPHACAQRMSSQLAQG